MEIHKKGMDVLSLLHSLRIFNSKMKQKWMWKHLMYGIYNWGIMWLSNGTEKVLKDGLSLCIAGWKKEWRQLLSGFETLPEMEKWGQSVRLAAE